MTRRRALATPQRCVALYRQHRSIRKVAALLGVGYTWVRTRLIEARELLQPPGGRSGVRAAPLDPATVLRVYQRTGSIARTAKQLRCHTRRVIPIIRAAQAPAPLPVVRRPDLVPAELAAMYQAGMSIRAIARQQQCGYGTVRRRLRDAGIPLRPIGSG